LSTRWFLATLLGIAILMALATCLYRLSPVAASMKRAFTWMEEHPAACWTGYLASVGLACFALAASSRILQDNVLLLGCFEWRSIIYYAPAYALGAVMWARPKLFNWFLEPSRFDWILALVAFGVLIFTDLGPSGIWLIINKLTWVPFGLLISRVFLSAMHRYANAPRPWVARLIDASFVIYIWHIVFVLALNDIWFKLAIWPGLAIILSSIGAFAASWAMYLVVRQSTLLSLAFNGGPLRPSGASPMRRDRARS